MTRMTAGSLTFEMSDLILKPKTDGISKGRRLYTLQQSFVVRVNGPGLEAKYVVPLGFETDLASIPTPLTWAIGTPARYAEAAVVHDYAVVNGWPWFVANGIMRSLLLAGGHSWWRRVAIFYGIQGYGYFRRREK